MCATHLRTVLHLLFPPSPPLLMMDHIRFLTVILVAVAVRAGLVLPPLVRLPPVLPPVVLASMG